MVRVREERGRGQVRERACLQQAGRRRKGWYAAHTLVMDAGGITRLTRRVKEYTPGNVYPNPLHKYFFPRVVLFSFPFAFLCVVISAGILIPFPQMFASLGLVFSEVETLLWGYSACKAVVGR